MWHAICRSLARFQKAGSWFGLFHRDPKRIVGVLRVTLLNRLNNSTEWAELPFGRQTLHHDWLLPYRGLQASLFVLSLGIELTHFLHPKLPTVIRIGEQDSGRAVPPPPDDRVCWQTMVLGHSREPPSGGAERCVATRRKADGCKALFLRCIHQNFIRSIRPGGVLLKHHRQRTHQ